METALITLVIALVTGGLGAAAGYWYRSYRDKREIGSARVRAESIVTQAEAESKELVLSAKDEALTIRDKAEAEANRRRQKLQNQEERLVTRREKLDRRYDHLEGRARNLDKREKKLEREEQAVEEMHQRRMSELERIAGLSREEAHEELLARIEEEARADAARVIREVEMQTRDEAERRAREIIVAAMQRCATDYVADNVVSTLSLPNDDMKGRIIGRQGRNIRAFEHATGVDVIVDDTPETVLLSCFDPVRREIGRQALQKLVNDGRIHPARIESTVEKTKGEVDAIIREEGEKAAYKAKVPGLPSELLKLLGRLKFRTSYGQNVLQHSIETAHLAAMLAAEIGADGDIARAGALLHDIGKAVSHEVEGPHALIGADIAKRHGMGSKIVNAIGAHHHEDEPQCVETIIVEAADAISGARPGARRETLEMYVKRIKALENIAREFDGVDESYAIQAGRELRIIVKPDAVDDLAAIQLSRDIAKKVEESLEYPGQVKVAVIRETRAIEYAK
ncbi:MAG: Ribonuclease Y [Anaerolineales bacterium]|nr:Ribonuclease Y [Anaerolineales bacterium]